MAEKTSKAAWIKNKSHTVTCPSGTQIDMQIPPLAKMIQTGQIPNPLLDVALEHANTTTEERPVTRDDIEKQAEFYDWLVSVSVVSPKVTPDEVGDLPAEDVEMIVQIATRQRDYDAVYAHIAGLEKVQSFARFRGLPSGDEDLVDE